MRKLYDFEKDANKRKMMMIRIIKIRDSFPPQSNNNSNFASDD